MIESRDRRVAEEDHMDTAALASRFELRYDPANHRRVIAEKDVIIHCHHYNARVQRTIEGTDMIDGKAIIRSSAEAVFAEQIAAALREGDDAATKLAVAIGLYAHLGFGVLDFSTLAEGRVRATSSHYVEGWLAGFGTPERPVCSFAEGYIQAAVRVVDDRLVHARERACMAKGDPACVFELDDARAESPASDVKHEFEFSPKRRGEYLRSNNVDEQALIDALVAMPIHGNAEGLIPAFSVYLANTPADYYNLVCIRFVEAMAAKRRERAAKRMLIADGEICAMNTFRGIMNSAEWDALVAPMIREPRDKMLALVAISNGLGWGNWHITHHPNPERISFESLNGYEAIGYGERRGPAASPTCYMLTGVAAGLLELVYGSGAVEDRLGTCATHESACICVGAPACSFEVERTA
ncbi:MAG: V4R domain-containing protein [Enhygromyxa sp.]